MAGTRAEHLAFAKQRALEYSTPEQAVTAFISDLGKHPETVRHPALSLLLTQVMAGHLADPVRLREQIEGFR